MNSLTIRHELHPERRCFTCDRTAEFYFDCPGEICTEACHYHAPQLVAKYLNSMHAEALRAYDQQTTRLRALGKPCTICGVRREDHIGQEEDHHWTDDEDDAEAYERDCK